MAGGRIAPIPTALPGVEDLFSLLSFLSDAKRYEARVAEIQGLIDACNKAIAAYGTVEEIGGVLARTQSQYDEAKAIRAAAEREAVTIKQKAIADRDAAIMETDLAKSEAAHALEEIKLKRDAWAHEVEDRERNLAPREREVERLKTEHEKGIEEVRLLRTELAARLEKIKAAAAGAG